MMPTRLRAPLGQGALALLFVLGCSRPPAAARAPTPGFLRASPIIEHEPPTLEATGDPDDVYAGSAADDPPSTVEPLLAKEVPVEHPQPPPTPSTPSAVIAEANAIASQAPDAAGFLNAV